MSSEHLAVLSKIKTVSDMVEAFPATRRNQERNMKNLYSDQYQSLTRVISNTGKTGGKSDFLVAPTRLVPIQAICEPSG
jgi:hypothetical protein